MQHRRVEYCRLFLCSFVKHVDALGFHGIPLRCNLSYARASWNATKHKRRTIKFLRRSSNLLAIRIIYYSLCPDLS